MIYRYTCQLPVTVYNYADSVEMRMDSGSRLGATLLLRAAAGLDEAHLRHLQAERRHQGGRQPCGGHWAARGGAYGARERYGGPVRAYGAGRGAGGAAEELQLRGRRHDLEDHLWLYGLKGA